MRDINVGTGGEKNFAIHKSCKEHCEKELALAAKKKPSRISDHKFIQARSKIQKSSNPGPIYFPLGIKSTFQRDNLNVIMMVIQIIVLSLTVRMLERPKLLVLVQLADRR